MFTVHTNGEWPKKFINARIGLISKSNRIAPTTAGNVPTSIDVEAMAIKVLMVRVMSIKKAIGGRGGLSAAHTIPGFNY